MKKIGDKVRIKSFDWYEMSKDNVGHACRYGYSHFFSSRMAHLYCGKELVIINVAERGLYYLNDTGYGLGFHDWMFEQEE